MFRSSRADHGARTFQGIARATITKVDDKPKVQEIDIELLRDEKKVKVESFGQYGFKAVPLPPSGKNKAEAIVAFMGGNRSHAVILAHDDRRHRPRNWQPGEVGMYDDQGQTVHLKRGGIEINGGALNKPIELKCGSASIKISNGKIVFTAADMYLVGNVSAGVDGENKPVKVKTVNDTPADKLWTKE